jgi:hypothetical protein
MGAPNAKRPSKGCLLLDAWAGIWAFGLLSGAPDTPGPVFRKAYLRDLDRTQKIHGGHLAARAFCLETGLRNQSDYSLSKQAGDSPLCY